MKTVYATIPKVDTQKPEETEQSQDKQNSIPKKDMDQSKQCNANVKITNQIKKESTKTVEREGSRELVNGAVKSESLKSIITEANRLQTLFVSKTEAKSVSQDRVTKPSVATLSLGLLTPPVIKIAPVEVSGTGSGDEVQSMEVSPVSKEELISIPEFSPVSDTLNSALNNNKALEDLMDLTGSVTYPRLSPQNPIGDCNQI
uniref:Uncharacterized protein n=1 Tax=Neogobius melanostomus TaxID=47308 RepID=A0A8C6T267_9GOBI